jgi:hypothetical protein
MKKNYLDLCRPSWIQDNPDLFYGFWGKCRNDYRETIPHEGYNILKKWKDDMFGLSNSTYAAFRDSLTDLSYQREYFKIETDESGNVNEQDDVYFPGNCFVYTSNVSTACFNIFLKSTG